MTSERKYSTIKEYEIEAYKKMNELSRAYFSFTAGKINI
jgi:hypothetical protein